MACSLGFYGDGISFLVVLNQSFWLRVLPGGACLVQTRWRPERRILGGGWTGGVSFWPFPNSSGWWRLISSLFLTRTSCCKTTHANGYYGLARVASFNQCASSNSSVTEAKCLAGLWSVTRIILWFSLNFVHIATCHITAWCDWDNSVQMWLHRLVCCFLIYFQTFPGIETRKVELGDSE